MNEHQSPIGNHHHNHQQEELKNYIEVKLNTNVPETIDGLKKETKEIERKRRESWLGGELNALLIKDKRQSGNSINKPRYRRASDVSIDMKLGSSLQMLGREELIKQARRYKSRLETGIFDKQKKNLTLIE